MKPEVSYQYLVFTDLDGSLLDHYTYEFADALSQVQRLERERIPLIFTSSKTRAEIVSLRERVGNRHPFIVENGAAVYIPEGYFAVEPDEIESRDGFWVYEMSESRAHWRAQLAALEAEFPGEFESFSQLGAAGVATATGLSIESAERANDREYSEPVHWLSDENRKLEFISRLLDLGTHVLAGGRFLGISGDVDKGRALAWLRTLYQDANPAMAIHDLAVGDSANDCAMLETAETALLIRSPVHDFPQLQRDMKHVISSELPGPAGWAEGVAKWLSTHGKL